MTNNEEFASSFNLSWVTELTKAATSILFHTQFKTMKPTQSLSLITLSVGGRKNKTFLTAIIDWEYSICLSRL